LQFDFKITDASKELVLFSGLSFVLLQSNFATDKLLVKGRLGMYLVSFFMLPECAPSEIGTVWKMESMILR